ncbi:MAG TPA: serine hydroxymethyltransferase [Planctomycetota bacterium]|nr:serine hydroxymethyltransferase [Planctomycetota bacterium]
MSAGFSALVGQRTDADVWAAIDAECARQEDQLELIASENHASPEVIAAMGTALTNKYAEGYPGRRYYGGCEHVDDVENLARTRAKQVFSVGYANVQPHSGTQANMGALMAMLAPGERVLAMDLDHGGHLSHGHPKNFSGVFYDFEGYGVNRETERIDLEQVAAMAREFQPKVILAGASAYPRTIDFAGFAAIAKEVGASLLVDMAHIAGLVAAGVHPSPVPHADVVTLTTHKTLRGPRGGMILTDSLDWLKKLNSTIFPGGQGGPLMHVIAAKAIALREAASPGFVDYQRGVVANAHTLAEALMAHGLRLVSGGTDNHLLLVDVNAAGLSGAEAENALHSVDITCNKNLIPFDQRPPMEASGIRLGTAAVTTRGLGETEMVWLAGAIAERLEHPEDEAVAGRLREEVAETCRRLPIY